MLPPDDDPPREPTNAEPADPEADQDDLEVRRERVLGGVANGAFDTMEQKVAWILNAYPATRDSDVALQLQYWNTFVENFDPATFSPDDLYQLPRLTSLSRARATIQNKLKLFQATAPVRKRRGTLEEAERERAVRDAAYPVFAVYADESGKTQDNFVVGSLWVLRSEETLRLLRAFKNWRADREFFDELHFTNINDSNVQRYVEAVDLVIAHAAALGFKCAILPRHGAGNVREAISEMFYQILVRGIEHETATGRAPLPRTLQLWKDAEQEAYDTLLLADINDRLVARFQDQLPIDFLRARSSRGADLLQIADLFTGSVNRITNLPSPAPTQANAKDQLAEYFLNAIHWAQPGTGEGDMAVSVNI